MAVPSNAINAQGVQLLRGDGGSPEILSLIGEVQSFDGPGGSATVIDVSTLQSLAKEKRMGLPDEGQFTFEVNLDPSDTQQMGLVADRKARVKRHFRMILTDAAATTLNWDAFVLDFKINGSVDNVVKASVTLEITGPVDWS